jgi:hypothetical protein
VSKPGEANRRAVMRVNPWIKPRNAKMRVASVSKSMKPALWRSRSIVGLPQALRGSEGQRGGTDELGTWESPGGACGVNRTQPVTWRINKPGERRRDVGEAHSSDERGESRGSQGALATDMRTQKLWELIGR